MALRLGLLGPPLVEVDGRAAAFDTRKAVAVLAYLAVSGQAHRRETLSALCWPEADRERASAALRRTLSAIRSSLGPHHLLAGKGLVALDTERLHSDIADTRRLIATCDSHPHGPAGFCPGCVEPLRRAADLHRGAFLEGFALRDSPAFDDWQFFVAEEQRRELAALLERLVHASLGAGDLPAATTAARRWLLLDQLHEPAHRELMRLYAWQGQRGAALRQYRECVRVLDRELGVRPLDDTTALHAAIVEQRLADPPRPAAVTATERSQPPSAPAESEAAAAAVRTFVGRRRELEALVEAVCGVGSAGLLAAVEGEAGIGKTRLVAEVLADPRLRNRPSLTAAAYEGEAGLPYALIASVLSAEHAGEEMAAVAPADLAEAARLVPALAAGRSLPQPPPLDSPGGQARFVGALDRVVAAAAGAGAGGPAGILVVDDLHWADDASLDVLARLARRPRPLVIIAAWRTEQVPRTHRLRRLLSDLRRDGRAVTVSPARLDAADVADLVSGWLPATRVEPDRVFADTEGLPLLVVEYLAGVAGGQQPPDGGLGGGARDVLLARLDSVSPAAGQVLAAAAVIGRSFDADTLRDASGRSEEEVAGAVEELLARRLVTEVPGDHGVPRYDFSHNQLRELAYSETGLARRRLLHRRVAQSLQVRVGRGPATGPVAGIIAGHWRRAGDDEAAAHWEAEAGRHAASLLAVSSAIGHYRDALALGHPQPAVLHEALGDLHTLEGRYDKASASYEAAVAVDAGRTVAGVEHKLGMVLHRQGEFALADHYLGAALGGSRAGDATGRARILADRAVNAHRRGAAAEAAGYARDAAAAAEAAADPRARAQAANVAGLLARAAGDHRAARRELERSLGLARELADAGAEVAALNNLALVAAAQGATSEAVRLATAALDRMLAVGDRHREAALHNNLADLLRLAGRQDEAMVHLKKAVAIFAEIGEPGVLAPEIWKLVAW